MVVHVCEASKQQQRREGEEQVSLGHLAGLPGRLGRRKGNPDEKDKFPEIKSEKSKLVRRLNR